MRKFLAAARKKLGFVKLHVIDRWPYKLQELAASRRRAALAGFVRGLPPLAAGGETELCGIHMMCGHKHADMGLLASWSLLRFDRRLKLFVHSDGTLTEEDKAVWSKVIPEVAFTDPAARDALVERRLPPELTALRQWRKHHLYSIKLIDTHLYGASGQVVCLDSDVLCFKHPGRLLELMASGEAVAAWNGDIATSYPVPPEKIFAVAGIAPPQNFNAGFLLSQRFGEADFRFLDGMIQRFEAQGVNVRHMWFEQALYGVMAARHPQQGPLPPQYAIQRGRTKDDAVLRHYVGVPKIRPRFFLEGLPILQRQAREESLTPAGTNDRAQENPVPH